MTTSPEAAPAAEVRETRPKILEAADCSFGGPRGADFALTCEWPDGTETIEHVSEHAARFLGYDPDENGDPKGAEATVSLDREGAWHIASAMVPEIERFRTEHRDAMKAIHELKVEHRPNAVEMLKAVADEIDCDSGCEHSFYDGSCNATECSKHEAGEFCGWMMAARLRDLAEGLEIRERIAIRATQQGAGDVG